MQDIITQDKVTLFVAPFITIKCTQPTQKKKRKKEKIYTVIVLII